MIPLGAPAACRSAEIDALLGTGGNGGIPMQHADDTHEAGIDPLIVSAGGAAAADARFVLT